MTYYYVRAPNDLFGITSLASTMARLFIRLGVGSLEIVPIRPERS